jgi:hypothetical protein
VGPSESIPSPEKSAIRFAMAGQLYHLDHNSHHTERCTA